MRYSKYFMLFIIIVSIVIIVGCERDTESNKRPDKPEITAGPDSGYQNTPYSFTVYTTDSNDDNIYYQFDWDDGNKSFWSNVVLSGTPVMMSHTWQVTGTFSVRARAKDVHGLESYWSEKHNITIQ
jgi:hypothetical protein